MFIEELLRQSAIRRLLHTTAPDRLTRRDVLKRLRAIGIDVGLGSALLAVAGEGYPALAQSKPFKGQTLVVTSYGGPWQQFMENEHIPRFEDMTGAKVELAIGLAKDWFARMQVAGKDNPPYDVFVGNETYVAQLRLEGYFTPLPLDQVPNLAPIPKELRQPGDVGVLGLVGALGIAYRSDKVKTPPKSWKDLANYGDKTAIFTIGNSGEPQHVMKMAEILTGNYQDWQPAVQWIGKNLCAAKQVDFSGTEQTMLTQGEVDVGLIDAPDWALLKSKGMAVDWVLPTEDYCGMFEQDMNVASGSKVKPLGFAFINYWLSDAVQKKWAEKFYWTPANPHVDISAAVKPLIPVTPDQFHLIPRWNYVWLNTSGARDAMSQAWYREVTGHC
jgi:putative spermidine/putrescine transport system substrate-binding protein